MRGHMLNGRRILALGTYVILERGTELGRLNASCAEQATKRAAKRFRRPPERLDSVEVLPPIFAKSLQTKAE